MAQAEAVKEGCSIYNRSELCPGKGTSAGLSQVGEGGLRCPQTEPALQEGISLSQGADCPHEYLGPVSGLLLAH